MCAVGLDATGSDRRRVVRSPPLSALSCVCFGSPWLPAPCPPSVLFRLRSLPACPSRPRGRHGRPPGSALPVS
eukprot:1241770-Alexandrium_andersonii.AAC.1